MDIRSRLEKRLNQAISEQVFPGAVVGVVRKNGDRNIVTAGTMRYESDAQIIQADAIYDLASVTKSIPTTSLALQLIDQGKLKLDDKLINYLPEFRNAQREEVLIRHLLTYALPSHGVADYKQLSPEQLFDVAMTEDFDGPPGSVFKYANITVQLLGYVIERATGETLDVRADRELFKPLEMFDTTFHPHTLPAERIVPTEVCQWRDKLICGEVHDESAHIFYHQGGRVVGHAGLFSTAPDLLNFLEMLLNNGVKNNHQFFSPEMVKHMQTNQLAGIGEVTGLGWELAQPRYMGSLSSSVTFGKTGFTGTLVLCDIPREVGIVILSNRIHPKRPADSVAINRTRAALADIIFDNL